MDTTLLAFHKRLLTEGRTKKGAKAVLAQALRPHEDTDNPGLVYISPELVSDIKAVSYTTLRAHETVLDPVRPLPP
mgnify:CR=1 FL=1